MAARSAVQRALMKQFGPKEWFGTSPEDPDSMAAKFSNYCDSTENLSACLSTDISKPEEVKKLLDKVSGFKKDSLH